MFVRHPWGLPLPARGKGRCLTNDTLMKILCIPWKKLKSFCPGHVPDKILDLSALGTFTSPQTGGRWLGGDKSPPKYQHSRTQVNLVIHHDKFSFPHPAPCGWREEHTVALKAHHLPGRQIHNGHQRLAHQLLLAIELMNAGNLTVRAGTVISVKRRSFPDFFTASQALTLTARKSDLQNVSEVHLSVSCGSPPRRAAALGSGLGGLQLLQRLVHIQAGGTGSRP